MTWLIFGKSGQVATDLSALIPDAIFLGRNECNLSVEDNAYAAIMEHRPKVIINAAAYTAVDKAEDERDLAFQINGAAPAEMAKAAAETDASLIHISTDYVFEGSGDTPWMPSHPTNPQGVYGASKLAGEKAIFNAGARAAILRTSWVFSAHGANFVKTMLRLGQNLDELNIVSDQIGGPTPSKSIAKACIEMGQQLSSDKSKSGVYHFSGSPDVSWAEFARVIFEKTGLVVQVNPIPSSEYPTPAKRPLNSRLDCGALDVVFGIKRPDWRSGLGDVLKELGYE